MNHKCLRNDSGGELFEQNSRVRKFSTYLTKIAKKLISNGLDELSARERKKNETFQYFLVRVPRRELYACIADKHKYE